MLSKLFLILAACTSAGALRVTVAAPPAPTLARTVAPLAPATAALRPRAAAPSMLAAKDVEVSPLMAVFAGGGVAGVFFAAFCTSNGSPPTGLAVGILSCLFMAAGAALIESDGLPKRE